MKEYKSVKFKDVKTGQYFYDNFSGETFKKMSKKKAKCVSGGDFFEGDLDSFEANDEVEIEV